MHLFVAKSKHARWLDKKNKSIILNQKSRKYYTLNGSAALIWHSCNGLNSGLKIAEIIAKNYGLTTQKARYDTSQALVRMSELGLTKLSKRKLCAK